MYHGKPIIGIAGGIGSGKSFVARLFGEMGCMVISSDDLVRQAYKDSAVKQQLKHWWGKLVFDPSGEVDRSAVARKIFTAPSERQRLERLLHPIANQARERMMKQAGDDPNVVAFVWDTPLLFETELNKLCDRVVFVDAPLELRERRVREKREWSREELLQRENLQLPLDNKRRMSHDVVVNTADADGLLALREQVREVLSRTLAGNSAPANQSAGLASP